MADDTQDATQTMPRHQRYYALHREDKLAKDKERYNNKPEVIAKREERERKRIEKEAEKIAKKEAEKEEKRIEKERVRQEKLALALATSKKQKIEGATLDAFLNEGSPA
jgi:hypothetical protein